MFITEDAFWGFKRNPILQLLTANAYLLFETAWSPLKQACLLPRGGDVKFARMVRAEGAAPRRTGAGAGRGRGVLGRGRARSSLSPPPQLAYHTVLGAVFRQKREMKRYAESRR